MFKCAQIDTLTGKCTSVSFLSAEVIADHIIPLSAEDDVNPGDTYDNGTWIPAPPPEQIPPGPTDKERITQLEAELAAAKNANLDTMDALFDVYLMVLDMQLGGSV